MPFVWTVNCPDAMIFGLSKVLVWLWMYKRFALLICLPFSTFAVVYSLQYTRYLISWTEWEVLIDYHKGFVQYKRNWRYDDLAYGYEAGHSDTSRALVRPYLSLTWSIAEVSGQVALLILPYSFKSHLYGVMIDRLYVCWWAEALPICSRALWGTY